MWRACEESLHAEGLSVFPSGAPWTHDWVNLGIALANRLTSLGYFPIEVYPYASRLGLGIGTVGGRTMNKHTAEGRASTLDDLARFGVELGQHRETLAHDHDALDSVICAYTGLLWATKRDRIRNIGDSRPFAVPLATR